MTGLTTTVNPVVRAARPERAVRRPGLRSRARRAGQPPPDTGRHRRHRAAAGRQPTPAGASAGGRRTRVGTTVPPPLRPVPPGRRRRRPPAAPAPGRPDPQPPDRRHRGERGRDRRDRGRHRRTDPARGRRRHRNRRRRQHHRIADPDPRRIAVDRWPASSAAASTSAPEPVPGLPHSTPLPEQVLVGSRSVDGSSNLYQFDAATGALGKQLTTGSPGTQFAILSPDRGSIIYLQTSPTGATLRTMAVDGTGDRELFAQLPSGCTTIFRPAWNPIDQTTLALTCVDRGRGTPCCYQVSVDGSDPRLIDTGFPVVDDVTYSPGRHDAGLLGLRGAGRRGHHLHHARRRAAARPSSWSTGHRAAATPTRRSPRTAARSPSGGCHERQRGADGADHRRQRRRLEPRTADRRDRRSIRTRSSHPTESRSPSRATGRTPQAPPTTSSG